MAVTANSIITPQTPKGGTALTTTANTTYTSSPTNTAILATMGVNGGRVTRVRSIPRAAVTATGLHLFLSTDAGATKVLIDSALMAAHTHAATTEIPSTDWGYSETNAMVFPATAILYVSAAVTGDIAHHIEWADY